MNDDRQNYPYGHYKHFRRFLRSLFLLSALLLITLSGLFIIPIARGNSANDETPTTTSSTSNQVILDGQPLFVLESSDRGQTREERAEKISQILLQIAMNRAISLDTLSIKEQPNLKETQILAGDKVIISISEADAEASGKERNQIAYQYLEVIKEALANYREDYSPEKILEGVAKSAGATVVLLLLLRLSNQFYKLLRERTYGRWGDRIPTVRVGSRDLLQADRIKFFLSRVATLVRIGITLALISIYLNIVLSSFPQTRSLSVGVFTSIFSILTQILQGAIAYLPKLLFLIVFSYVIFYLLKFVRFFFKEIEGGELNIVGFEREWALPTSRIIYFLILALFGMIAFPYLPGAGSEAFQGISIFLGILISLGSSSAITNIIAGILLTYTRAFRIGDKVDIGGMVGIVMEKGLLVTRLMTDNNLFVNIPNGNVLSNNVTNFRIDSEKDGDVIPPPKVTLLVNMSYEVPWEKVYFILLNAAKQTEYVLNDPAPYVLHHTFKDFCVVYELSVYTNNNDEDDVIRSDLLRGIQQYCSGEGIQLMIPQFFTLPEKSKYTSEK